METLDINISRETGLVCIVKSPYWYAEMTREDMEQISDFYLANQDKIAQAKDFD